MPYIVNWVLVIIFVLFFDFKASYQSKIFLSAHILYIPHSGTLSTTMLRAFWYEGP